MTFSDAERTTLVRRARAAIARVIGVEEAADANPAAAVLPDPEIRAGAFVSIHVGRALRGCIGYPEPELQLLDAIERCACSAAVSDPRFPPLAASEWPRVSVEISVLGAIEPVDDLSQIEIGRHGLIVEQGGRRGLLLPQVAVEWNLTPEEFAGHTCRKAGLAADAWRGGAKLFRFEAEVFSG